MRLLRGILGVARFLEFADDLMGRKAFVQMRRMVEAFPVVVLHVPPCTW